MSKITESARNEECQVRIANVCNFNPETTIWAHANDLAAGKGKGLKAHDINGAYCCSACHDVYDRRRRPPEGMKYSEVELDFAKGHYRSVVLLAQKGLI